MVWALRRFEVVRFSHGNFGFFVAERLPTVAQRFNAGLAGLWLHRVALATQRQVAALLTRRLGILR